MGRVHKALVRADRWADLQQPIGKPAVTKGEEQVLVDSTASSNIELATGTAWPDVIEPLEALALDWKSEQALDLPRPSKATPEPPRTIDVQTLTIDRRLAALGGEPLASERYRTIAMRLISIAAARRLKTIVVTSADHGEGKTTVAANLAWAMARASGGKVLLLDASIYAPAVAAALGIEATSSWADIVSGAPLTNDSMVCIEPARLTVLAIRAGAPVAANGDGFLGGKNAGVLLDELRADFDLVFIDAPSLIGSGEAQWLVTAADATVIVVRSGHTRGARLEAARKMVPKTKRLGIVLNDLPVKGGRLSAKRKRPNNKDGWLGTAAGGSQR